MSSRLNGGVVRRLGVVVHVGPCEYSFRERKENVNVQPRLELGRTLGVSTRSLKPEPLTRGTIMHEHKPSFLGGPKKALSKVVPESQASMAGSTRAASLIDLKSLCESRGDPGAAIGTVPRSIDVERQTANAMQEYGGEIELYQREIEQKMQPVNCLQKHEITPNLRAKMVDWMVEVLTNFKCNEQTFFLATSLMDRYLQGKAERKLIGELHIIGVTAMYLASKYEDIVPLRMNLVHEKIAHKKLSPEAIRGCEHDFLVTLNFVLQAPTVHEFLTRYCKVITSPCEDKQLVTKMALYLAKMAIHDYYFSSIRPSLLAISSLYVGFKICEQLRKTRVLSQEIVEHMVHMSGYSEDTIIECARRVLSNAQNFDQLFPGLNNLKKTHFTGLMEHMPK